MCISSYSKRSVDELFERYFYNLSSTYRGKAPDSHRESIPGPLRPRTLNLPFPGKNLAGAHGYE